MNYFRKIRYFSIPDKVKIIKYSLGSFLVNSTPKGLKHSYHLLRLLDARGVRITKGKGFVNFRDPGTGFLVSLEQSSSDSQVYEQIFMQEEYRAVLEAVAEYGIPMKTMIDAGANVGFTTLYFKDQFHDLRVIAMERSPDVFKKLKRNVLNNQLKNVFLCPKGLWSSSARLKADRTFRDGQDWSFRIVEANESERADIETLSTNDLIELNELVNIDFLKIDIEGSEKQLFESESLSWLDITRVLAIEIHDEFNCRDDIEGKLREKGFRLSRSGELTVGVNQNLF